MEAPIPVATRSKAWVCGHSLAGIVGSKTRRDNGRVFLVNTVLLGRGLCNGLITRPEESHQLTCV
jgi:hypothetical protein